MCVAASSTGGAAPAWEWAGGGIAGRQGHFEWGVGAAGKTAAGCRGAHDKQAVAAGSSAMPAGSRTRFASAQRLAQRHHLSPGLWGEFEIAAASFRDSPHLFRFAVASIPALPAAIQLQDALWTTASGKKTDLNTSACCFTTPLSAPAPAHLSPGKLGGQGVERSLPRDAVYLRNSSVT